jgi:hypothetical protein
VKERATAVEVSADRLLMQASSSDRLTVLLAICGDAPAPQFWRMFFEWWSVCDRNWPHRTNLLKTLRRQARRELPILHFSPAQRAFFDDLPMELTVYRGCSLARVQGVSWSLDKIVAQGFARGHRGIPVLEPVVACGRIEKANIFGVCPDRKEAEVILDPNHITLGTSDEPALTKLAA